MKGHVGCSIGGSAEKYDCEIPPPALLFYLAHERGPQGTFSAKTFSSTYGATASGGEFGWGGTFVKE